MTCRRNSTHWDMSMNSTFNPGSTSSPRSIKPQSLFQSGLSAPRTSAPYPGFYNANSSVPVDYADLSSEFHPPPNQATLYNPRTATPQRPPMVTRKIIYETSNISTDKTYPAYRPPPRTANITWSQGATDPRRVSYPADATYYPNQSRAQSAYTPMRPAPAPAAAGPTDLDASVYQYQAPRQPPRSASTAYRTQKINDMPPSAYSTTMRTSGGQAGSTAAGRQEKPPCPGGCNKAKAEKIYGDYVVALRQTVVTALIRRKRMRAAMEQGIRYNEDESDCREKRTQVRAVNQMESNFHAEIISIYNDLMNSRKQLHHEMKNGKNSRSSLVSINVPASKRTNFNSPLKRTELDDQENDIAAKFTQIVIETIDEFCKKDIELEDAYSELTEKDACSETVSAFQQEYHKIASEMEEEFINIWEDYETHNCGCSTDDDECDLTTEMGLSLQEILAKQFKMTEDLEKKLLDECTQCQSQQSRSFPHADRLELSSIHVDVMNDLWQAMDYVKELMEERPSLKVSGYSSVFRALLAIFRKCNSQLKTMLDGHFDKRRMHQVENLSSIFVDDWLRLRQETIDEIKAIVDSLDPKSSTNLTCQERRLKKMQEKEKADVMEKYRTQRGSCTGGCRTGDEDTLDEELSALEQTHNEQWDTILWNKLQHRVDEIERVYPRESKEVCVQTCPQKKKVDLEDIEEDGNSVSCACGTNDDEEVDEKRSDKLRSRETKSEGNVKICKKTNESSRLPDLGDLTDIEVKEMKELQKNLRQWQMARRNLLESINQGIQQ